MKRHEIVVHLPLCYNDGSSIEPEKFAETAEELAQRFGGSTYLGQVSGTWVHEGRTYHDDLYVWQVVVERFDVGWWAGYKEILKARFCQLEIWILRTEVDVL